MTAPDTRTVTREAKHYKSDVKPVWCPGCGDFAVLTAITKALAQMGIAQEDTAVVTGIGCAARLPGYLNVYGLHGIHGRALPAATGLKLARPELTVLAAGGDGDGFSIGGNHFLHACRRNVDLVYIVMDNEVYGMTKGQASPTTEPDWSESRLTPQGPGVEPFHPLSLALISGANWIGRAFTGDPQTLTHMLVEAVNHPGLAFLHVLSPCVTYRPEQKDWKKTVRREAFTPTEDPVEAQRVLETDDGFNAGVLYHGRRPVYAPAPEATAGMADLDREFVL